MMTLPLALKTAIESGQCILFLGAGIGRHLIGEDKEPAPLAVDLAIELASHFNIDTDSTDLAKVAQTIVNRRGSRTELESFLRRRLANLQPDEALIWLFTLRWRAIFTTNFDHGIERCYDLIPNPKQNPVVITATSELVPYDPRFQVPIYHLHGTLYGTNNPQIIITRDDYLRFRERRRMIFELLKHEFATSTFLYIGYSNLDPNWNLVLEEMSQDFFPSSLPRSYRIAPINDELDVEYLASRNIETLPGYYLDFYRTAINNISINEYGNGLLEQIRATVPSDLLPEFDKNPAPIARLLTSWTYINQIPFNETPNLYQFLRGDHPNWSLIAAKKTFERDIEDELFEQLLDFATNDAKKPLVSILLAPAGFGTTTLLMKLAVRLVEEQAGAVFMMKREQRVTEGIIEDILSFFSDTVFFIVDNAADSSDELSAVIDRLSNLGKKAIFLLGERTNEWRQKRYKPIGKEFALEALSDPEINRLLDFLSATFSLNHLEDLDRDMQFAVIKQKHGKQLLVVMREATEGKSFDAILEDEYRGINNSVAQHLYTIVCCFNQYGAYVRDKLLAEMLGLSLADMYEQVNDAIEGVVVFDLIDTTKMIFGARARHRSIAEVVWVRTGDFLEQENIIQSALAKLNLNYRADNHAFEQFIRSERLIDSISTLESRTRFFETATRKDPDSPYVRQHFARMLLRAKHHTLALTQINNAIALNPRARILYHTKGLILSKMATDPNTGMELGRRYLVQSENAFRHALNLFQGDEYAYHGLAELFLNWAMQAPTQEESVDYLAKAEEIITESLKKVRNRETLWILSSQIRDWLGNEPSRLDALQKAIEANPTGVRARHLLGRAYRELGRPEDALRVLEPVIKYYFDEFRSFVEYALALIACGRQYREAIAVLNQSTLYGYGDPRFIATLGGMLFMNSEFSEAERVFAESNRRNFTYAELRKVQFQPLDPANLNTVLRLNGNVIQVKTGHSEIENTVFGRFICNASKYGGIIMERGLKISFEPAFTAQGPIAVRPQLV